LPNSPFAQGDAREVPVDPALQDTSASIQPKKKLTAKRTPQTAKRRLVEQSDYRRISPREKKEANKYPFVSGSEYDEVMPPLSDAPKETQADSAPPSPGLPSIEELATPSKKTLPESTTLKTIGASPEQERRPAQVTSDIPELQLEPREQPHETAAKSKVTASRAANASVARSKKRKATAKSKMEAARNSKKAKSLRSSTAAARVASPDLAAADAPALPLTPVSGDAGTVEINGQPNERPDVPRAESRASSIAGTIIGDTGPSALPKAKVPPRVELVWDIVTRKPGGGTHRRSWNTSGRFQDKTLPELQSELASDPKVNGFTFRLQALDYDFDVDYQVAFDQEGRFLLMKRQIAAFVQEWMRMHKNSAMRLIIHGEIELLVDDEDEAIGLAAMGVEEVQVDW
jgi:hypothetical protein